MVVLSLQNIIVSFCTCPSLSCLPGVGVSREMNLTFTLDIASTVAYNTMAHRPFHVGRSAVPIGAFEGCLPDTWLFIMSVFSRSQGETRVAQLLPLWGWSAEASQPASQPGPESPLSLAWQDLVH